ncbi:hypothetical protein AHF37_06942 [Paragonimus kellicotti]|nr:hypothetical protein AHF37_06942 [Paragonimus kellicotti]
MRTFSLPVPSQSLRVFCSLNDIRHSRNTRPVDFTVTDHSKTFAPLDISPISGTRVYNRLRFDQHFQVSRSRSSHAYSLGETIRRRFGTVLSNMFYTCFLRNTSHRQSHSAHRPRQPTSTKRNSKRTHHSSSVFRLSSSSHHNTAVITSAALAVHQPSQPVEGLWDSNSSIMGYRCRSGRPVHSGSMYFSTPDLTVMSGSDKLHISNVHHRMSPFETARYMHTRFNLAWYTQQCPRSDRLFTSSSSQLTRGVLETAHAVSVPRSLSVSARVCSRTDQVPHSPDSVRLSVVCRRCHSARDVNPFHDNTPLPRASRIKSRTQMACSNLRDSHGFAAVRLTLTTPQEQGITTDQPYCAVGSQISARPNSLLLRCPSHSDYHFNGKLTKMAQSPQTLSVPCSLTCESYSVMSGDSTDGSLFGLVSPRKSPACGNGQLVRNIKASSVLTSSSQQSFSYQLNRPHLHALGPLGVRRVHSCCFSHHESHHHRPGHTCVTLGENSSVCAIGGPGTCCCCCLACGRAHAVGAECEGVQSAVPADLKPSLRSRLVCACILLLFSVNVCPKRLPITLMFLSSHVLAFCLLDSPITTWLF